MHKKIIKLLKSYFKRTIFALALEKDGLEKLKTLRRNEFDEAKKLSDFIAIIIRSAFCLYMFFFFIHGASKEVLWIKSATLYAIGVFALIIYIKIHIHLIKIVLSYWLLDAADNFSEAVKIYSLGFAFLIALQTSYSIAYFVHNFAQNIGALP